MTGIKVLRLLAWLTTVTMLLAACTGGGPSPAGEPAGTGQPRGEFRVNLQGEPKTIDPNKANFATEIAVVSALFDGLLNFDKELKLIPALAQDIPSVTNGGISADGLTYTFKLRDGLVWSDGKPLTAKDFEYSLKRTLDPKIAGPYASFYHDIRGAKAYNMALGTKDKPATPSEAQLTELRDSVAVKATDDKTLQVTLEKKRATFAQLMALWPAYPVRQELVEQKGDQWIEAGSLIGNGPFKLTEWQHQDHITMVPNESYWGEKPKIAKLTWKMLTDEVAAFAAYQNGEIDLVSVPLANRKLVLSDPNFKNQTVRYNELVTFAIQFNTKDPPFSNQKLRQAIATSIDRQAFVEDVVQGIGKPAFGWIPPGMPGHDPDAGMQYKLDPAKGKQLLAEAGFPDGRGLPEIKFSYSDNAANKQLAEWLQGQLKTNLGLDVKLEPMEPKAYQAAYTNNQLMMNWTGWGADYPDPDNWLPDNYGSGKSSNHTQIADPELDRLMTQALDEPDDQKRLALWKTAQQRLLELVPIVPVYYRERLWVLKANVKGFQTTAKDNLPGNRFYNLVSVQ